MTETKKYQFHVNGMHCRSCVLLIESELRNAPAIQSVKSNLEDETVEVVGDFGNKSREDIAREFTHILSKHGYGVSSEEMQDMDNKGKWSDFKIAAPIALAFLVLFVALQKMGLVNLINVDHISYGTAFIIGIIASLSSCMAIVGGLLLSMSATFAKEDDKVKPQILFHVGRISSFFILGGIIGVIGATFQLNQFWSFALSFVIGLVMLILGLNLLDVFSWTKKVQPAMPKFLAERAFNVSKLNHTLTPFLVGIATFFLPCGFTQSMQIYSLSTGSFLIGGLTMLAFALGTFPVLALISFSSFSLGKGRRASVFFKTAGLIVVAFALLNIMNGLVVAGIIPPLFSF